MAIITKVLNPMGWGCFYFSLKLDVLLSCPIPILDVLFGMLGRWRTASFKHLGQYLAQVSDGMFHWIWNHGHNLYWIALCTCILQKMEDNSLPLSLKHACQILYYIWWQRSPRRVLIKCIAMHVQPKFCMRKFLDMSIYQLLIKKLIWIWVSRLLWPWGPVAACLCSTSHYPWFTETLKYEKLSKRSFHRGLESVAHQSQWSMNTPFASSYPWRKRVLSLKLRVGILHIKCGETEKMKLHLNTCRD